MISRYLRATPLTLLLTVVFAAPLSGCLTSADESLPPASGNNGQADAGNNGNNGIDDSGNNGVEDASNNGDLDTPPDTPLDVAPDSDPDAVDDASDDAMSDVDVEEDAGCPPGTSPDGLGECRTPDGCLAGEHDGGDGACVAVGVCIDGLEVNGAGVCVGPDGCLPGTHDGGDGQCVNAGTCLSGFHDGGDGRCLASGACVTGFHDGGDGVCIGLGTCVQGYRDGGDGACVLDGACSGGYHDGGAGDCVLEGDCSSGYRDGGNGTCVSQSQCAANFHDGGDGSCLPEGECVATYHDGGVGQCVRVGTCSAGHSDGGDGTCLPLGQCVAGYVVAHNDSDRDGYGSGMSVGCHAAPLAAGLSENATDCDDQDISAWRIAALYPDSDEDGYTAARQERCIGADLPPRTHEVASHPPGPGLYPAVFTVAGNAQEPWRQPALAGRPDGQGAHCRRPERGCGTLLVGDFNAQVPPNAVIVGLRVHVLRSRRGSAGDLAVESRVQLGMEGVLVGENRASSEPWPEAESEAVYGGPTDLWGITLAPEQLSRLSVAIEMSEATKNYTEPEIDYVWIEVFHDRTSDCDDADPMVWAPLFGHPDTDLDGYGQADGQVFCVGGYPGPLVLNGNDCDDAAANVRPNQTAYFSAPRTDGTFDYNCDDMDEPAAITTALSCGVTGTVCAVTNSAPISVAPCGMANGTNVCGFNAVSQCVQMTSSPLTRCR